MRKIAISLILCVLAGCASSGAYLEYKPAHWKGSKWAIAGKAVAGAEGDNITISINETNVISGEVSKQKPEKEFKGSYEGYDVYAKCKLASGGTHTCTVLIDSEMAGQLSF